MPTIIQKPTTSKNYSIGRTRVPDMIVIHVGVGTQQSIYNTFNDPASQVSAHYSVSNTGEIWQFVQEENTAWHAGIVRYPTSALVLSRLGVNPNAYSIGIEHEGGYVGDPNPEDFTEAQYKATAGLVAQIAKKWKISLDRIHIVGHREIRIDKTCPGLRVSVERIITMAGEYVEVSPVDKVAELKQAILAVLSKY